MQAVDNKYKNWYNILMNYREAMDFIGGTGRFGIRPGLERISRLAELLGGPQDGPRFVHVAGTNGKGSVCAFIAGILAAAGYKTGLFTSPYIRRFEERIQINGAEIPRACVAEYAAAIRGAVRAMLAEGCEHPTEFEILTAMAFLYFRDERCDIAVLEVGLGGEFDSTNIIKKPEVCVITNIGMDHTDVLGGTLREIAAAKSGIIKPGCAVAAYPSEAAALEVIREKCLDAGARLVVVNPGEITEIRSDTECQVFDYKRYKGLKIKLLGRHQILNAAVAAEAAEALAENGFAVREAAVRAGLERAVWPGRLEIVSRGPVVIVDGAHNPQGAAALAESLGHMFPGGRFVFIAGVLRDKAYADMFPYFYSFVCRYVTVTPDSPRALPGGELADWLAARGQAAEAAGSVGEAVKTALRLASGGAVVCAFGSLYFIGQVRACFERL